MAGPAINAQDWVNWTIVDVMLDTEGDGHSGGGIDWWHGDGLTVERTTLKNITGDGIWAWEVDGLRLIDNTVHTVHGANSDNVHLYRPQNYKIQGHHYELADDTDSGKVNFHSYNDKNGIISENTLIGGNYGIAITGDEINVK